MRLQQILLFLVLLTGITGASGFPLETQQAAPRHPGKNSETKQLESSPKKEPEKSKEEKSEKGPEPGGDKKLEIQRLEPSSPIVSLTSQQMTLTISGSQDGEKLEVVFAGPDSLTLPQREEKVSNSTVVTSLNLPLAGKWNVVVSSDKLKSQPFPFEVRQAQSVCQPDPNSPSVTAFRKIMRVMNKALLIFFIPLIVGLIVASSLKTNRWSLGDALAEESSASQASFMTVKM